MNVTNVRFQRLSPTTAPGPQATGADGSFTIGNVPAGKRTISVWHEKLGTLTKTVDVKPGAPTVVDFAYPPVPKT